MLEAITTTEGFEGFWTSRAAVPGEAGETLELEFAVAPLAFDLRLEQSDQRIVVRRTETLPPHCQVMVQLEEYAETGRANPVFA